MLRIVDKKADGCRDSVVCVFLSSKRAGCTVAIMLAMICEECDRRFVFSGIYLLVVVLLSRRAPEER